MITVPSKKKGANSLKNKLRSLTGLSMFYRDNLEFKPVALLKHINRLKESVFGPEEEKVETEDEKAQACAQSDLNIDCDLKLRHSHPDIESTKENSDISHQTDEEIKLFEEIKEKDTVKEKD
mmetsp:Transcript_43483/g.36415  ORF Transcript_43483/g.36415 Transcript_43483/m.36415 type:complete len:122 (-) Transcript_43483:35-400(-)